MSTIHQTCLTCKATFEVTTLRKDGQVACTSCGRVFHGDISPSQLWYVARGNKKIGALTFAELKRLAAEGQLKPADLVLRADSTQWIDAGAVNGLFPALVGASVPVPTPTTNSGSVAPTPVKSSPHTSAPAPVNEIPTASPTPSTPATESTTQPKHEATTKPGAVFAYLRGRITFAKILLGVSGLGTVIGFLMSCGFVCMCFSGPQTINASSSDKDIGSAVGLVIYGERWTNNQTGTIGEFPNGTGSCFAVSPNGHLLTNYHVVHDKLGWHESPEFRTFQRLLRERENIDCQPTVWVFFGRERHQATILHVNKEYDMAILKVDKRTLPFFALSRSDQPARETKVSAYGFPGAARIPLSQPEQREAEARTKHGSRIEDCFKDRDFEFTVTSGLVSSVFSEKSGTKWVQHNSAISGGNSGGPLVSSERTVLGINTLGIRGDIAQGIFHAASMLQMKQEIDRHVPGVVWK